MEQLALFPVEPPASESQVYIGSRAGFIKIGMSNNPERRARELRITLLKIMPGGVVEERQLHRRFAEARIDREWFMPSPELISFIAA